MAYDPAIVANAVLWITKERGLSVDHMKLQKLVFFVHAWSLALHGESVVDERPEAWTYGPVFDSLYQRLKGYGRAPIDAYVPTFNPVNGTHVAMVPDRQDSKTWDMVKQVVDRYGSFNALQLSALSHEPGGPWEVTRSQKASQIPNDLITSFYRQKLPPPNATAS